MIELFVTKIRSLLATENGKPNAALNFVRSVLLTSVVVTGAVVGMRQLGVLEGLELGAYDQMMRSLPDQRPDNRLLVVGISATDIQTRKEYPITDGTLAQLLEKIQQSQPRAIGVDILRDVPIGEANGRIALQQLLQKSDNLIAVCKLSSADQPGIAAAPGVPIERVGFADLPLDPGGTLRRSLLSSIPVASKVPPPNKHLCNIPDTENQVLSLSFQLALLYLEHEPKSIKPELDPASKEIKLGSTLLKRLDNKAGGYNQADVGNYQMMLNYRSQNAAKQVSLTEVLNGKVDPALFKDHIVLIGYTDPAVKDNFYTPYSAGARDSQEMSGVMIHAQNTSQILSAVLNNRPLIWYWSEETEIFWIWGWSLLGAILAWRIRHLGLFGVGLVVVVAALYGACYLLFTNGGWVPLVPPALAMVATAVIVVLIGKGYANAIVKNVKKVILKIDIDQEKKQQQLKEITETEAFAELEKKAAELRQNQGREAASVEEMQVATPTPQELEPTTHTEEVDYFEQLQQQADKLRNPDPSTPTPQELEPTTHTEEADYFEQLQQQSEKLKNTDQSNS